MTGKHETSQAVTHIVNTSSEVDEQAYTTQLIAAREKYISKMDQRDQAQIELNHVEQQLIENAKKKFTTLYVQNLIDKEIDTIKKYKLIELSKSLEGNEWSGELVIQLMVYDGSVHSIENTKYKENSFGKIFKFLSGGDEPNE